MNNFSKLHVNYIITDYYLRNDEKPSPTSTSTPPPNSKEAHKNEGFLKSAWHKLTHQHDNLNEEPKVEEKKDTSEKEEPKRASGSG